MGNPGRSLFISEGSTHMGSFWEFLIALSGIEDYVGRITRSGELELKPKSELTPKDVVIGK